MATRPDARKSKATPTAFDMLNDLISEIDRSQGSPHLNSSCEASPDQFAASPLLTSPSPSVNMATKDNQHPTKLPRSAKLTPFLSTSPTDSTRMAYQDSMRTTSQTSLSAVSSPLASTVLTSHSAPSSLASSPAMPSIRTSAILSSSVGSTNSPRVLVSSASVSSLPSISEDNKVKEQQDVPSLKRSDSELAQSPSSPKFVFTKPSNRSQVQRSLAISNSRKDDLFWAGMRLQEQIDASTEEERVEDSSGLTYNERMRKQLIEEIVTTEKDYVNDLELIARVFLQPLRLLRILKEEELATLFSNIELLVGVNKIMYEDLNKQITPTDPHRFKVKVGVAFLTMSPFLKIYSSYCGNQQKAFKALEELRRTNSNFHQFLEDKMQDKVCRGLLFSSFLIKPVQRICKYPLFIKDLIKYTSPTHDDYQKLMEAETKINEVVLAVNEFKRSMDSLQHVLELADVIEGMDNLVSPNRKFLFEFEANVEVDDGKRKPRHILAFNDILLMCKKREKKKIKYIVKEKVELDEYKLVQLAAELGYGLEFINDENRICVFFQSEAEYSKYGKSIREAVLQLKKNSLQKQKTQATLYHNI